MHTRLSFLRLFVVLLLVVLSGCSTPDYHSAVLYQLSKTSYERPRLSTTEAKYYNGNTIRVPRGGLAHFTLSELKVGWLAERNATLKRFSQTRLLPEQVLWLVIQVEGFKPNDFLRTSAKRSFIASAVKQNQNSEGYVPLDAAETSFALQTSDFEYEVTFTLYSVDNFRLKQVLGFAAKDNPGLIKIGSEALKQMGGSAVNFLWDPLTRMAKHEFGESFLFERLLLTAGAITEFKGMVYVVGEETDIAPQILPDGTSEAFPNNPTLTNTTAGKQFVLADLSDVASKSNLRKLGNQYGTKPQVGQRNSTSLHRDKDFQTAYSTTLSAINEPVTDEELRDTAANVLRFTLSAIPDQNRRKVSELRQLMIVGKRIEEQLITAREATTRYLTINNFSEAKSALIKARTTALNIVEKIKDFDGNKLKTAAEVVIHESSALSEANRPRTLETLSLVSDASDIAVITTSTNVLSDAGIIYKSRQNEAQIMLDAEHQVANVKESPNIPMWPDKVQETLTNWIQHADSLKIRFDDFESAVKALSEITDKSHFEGIKSTASKALEEFNNAVEDLSKVSVSFGGKASIRKLSINSLTSELDAKFLALEKELKTKTYYEKNGVGSGLEERLTIF